MGKATCTQKPPRLQYIAMSEVAKHGTPADCWTCVAGTVYEVPESYQHDGGAGVVHGMCGADGTQALLLFHKPSVMGDLMALFGNKVQKGHCDDKTLAAFAQQNILDALAIVLFIAVPVLVVLAARRLSLRTQDRLLRRPVAGPLKGALAKHVNNYLDMPLGMAFLLVCVAEGCVDPPAPPAFPRTM